MNPAKVSASDYINFLIATQKAYSCTEAERVQPASDRVPAHDAITRLLHRLEPSTSHLWQEAQPQVSLDTGISRGDNPVKSLVQALLKPSCGKRRWGHSC